MKKTSLRTKCGNLMLATPLLKKDCHAPLAKTGDFISCVFTAVPLTVRNMEWDPLPETVCRMDAVFERTWTYLQLVSGDGAHFMSRKV